jgi:peroxin-13
VPRLVSSRRGMPAVTVTNNCAGLTGSNTSTAPTATAMSSPPPLPSMPDSLSSVANRNASNYSSMNNRMSPYSSGYGGGAYSSPYSMGGMGGMGSMYGGMGGMGGMGSMYGGMGGMGGMGMGMGGMYGGMGMNGDPNNPASLTQSFSQSTAATFQLIENIVGAFGGFAQMLQSTYMATHSSFFGQYTRSIRQISALISSSHGLSR